MLAVRDGDIRRAILTALSRRGDPAVLAVGTPTAIEAYMSDPLLRPNCYAIALTLAEEDSAKRTSVARMLCSYVVGYPPEAPIARRIAVMCEAFLAKGPEDAAVLRELLRLARALLDPPPLRLTVARPPQHQQQYGAAGGGGGGYTYSPNDKRSQAPDYAVQLPSFQPLSEEIGRRSTDRVPIPRCTEAECAAITEEKNHSLRPPRVLFQPARCRDYASQSRLPVTQSLLEQQIKALGTYDDAYKSSPSVIRATNFVIKVMCDAYVAKIPLGGGPGPDRHYCLLREVSVAFVSIFLKLLESEYLCVRLHIFDTLLTLAVHMQLIDTSGTFSGLPAALQEELTWLYGKVLEKMARTETIESVWLAALKSTLATIPPSGICTLDPLVLRQWLLLPTVAPCHPHIHAALSEALALRLLGLRSPLEIGTHAARSHQLSGGGAPFPSPPQPSSSRRPSSCTVVGAPDYHQNHALEFIISQLCPSAAAATAASPHPYPPSSASPSAATAAGGGGGSSSASWAPPSVAPTASGFIVDEAHVMTSLGPHGVTELIQFYAAARTVSARLYLFVVLFGIAAWRQRSGLLGFSATAASAVGAGGGGGGGSNSVGTGGVPPLAPQQLARILRILVAKSLHWHLHAIIAYQSHAIASDLPAMLAMDAAAASADGRDLQAPLATMVVAVLTLVGPYRRLPDMLTAMLHHTADDFFALGQVARECCAVLPYMVREDTDFSLRRTAGQMVFHLLRILRSPQHCQQSDAAAGTPDDAIAALLTAVCGSTVPKVRELAGELIASFSVLCRTNPQHAKTFTDLVWLAAAKEKNPAMLMAITYGVVEGLAVQHGGLAREGDVFSFACQGDLRLLAKSAALMGPSIFWLLYWGLRHSQLYAAQRARFVLLAILAALPPPEGSSATAQIALWVRCMPDPYPPAAYAASQHIVRTAAVGCHRIYEVVIDELQAVDAALVRNPYAMATCIWEFVEAESKVVVE